jgi:endonuclease/exonuclease/phosphatase family metal-dependent hydrolase
VATDGPSKLYWSDDDQFAECIELAKFIRQIEKDLGHSRTILVGDFNMNPFEKGMIVSNGLHAMMSKRIARREARTVKGVRYPFFYNPMWSLFGDIPTALPGTYFYNRSGRPLNYFWNMFDQVMLRPSLLDAFKDDYLRILESVGDVSLLSTHGTPDPTKASDHLPLLFALDL